MVQEREGSLLAGYGGVYEEPPLPEHLHLWEREEQDGLLAEFSRAGLVRTAVDEAVALGNQLRTKVDILTEDGKYISSDAIEEFRKLHIQPLLRV